MPKVLQSVIFLSVLMVSNLAWSNSIETPVPKMKCTAAYEEQILNKNKQAGDLQRQSTLCIARGKQEECARNKKTIRWLRAEIRQLKRCDPDVRNADEVLDLKGRHNTDAFIAAAAETVRTFSILMRMDPSKNPGEYKRAEWYAIEACRKLKGRDAYYCSQNVRNLNLILPYQQRDEEARWAQQEQQRPEAQPQQQDQQRQQAQPQQQAQRQQQDQQRQQAQRQQQDQQRQQAQRQQQEQQRQQAQRQQQEQQRAAKERAMIEEKQRLQSLSVFNDAALTGNSVFQQAVAASKNYNCSGDAYPAKGMSCVSFKLAAKILACSYQKILDSGDVRIVQQTNAAIRTTISNTQKLASSIKSLAAQCGVGEVGRRRVEAQKRQQEARSRQATQSQKKRESVTTGSPNCANRPVNNSIPFRTNNFIEKKLYEWLAKCGPMGSRRASELKAIWYQKMIECGGQGCAQLEYDAWKKEVSKLFN